MKNALVVFIGLFSLNALAYDYKTSENICGKVIGIASSAKYTINQNDAASKHKSIGMIVDGKAGSYIFDTDNFPTRELHADAKEMANTALANPNLELCLKGSTKHQNTNQGVSAYGFQWIEARLRIKP